MIKTRSVSKSIQAWYEKGIDEFINEYLEKYEVVQIIQTPYVTNDAFINITIIYKEIVAEKE